MPSTTCQRCSELDVWEVTGPWPGKLAVCSRPRAGWFLEDDLSQLRAAGYSLLISALTTEEMAKAELDRVEEFASRIGLLFEQFPVGNLQVPELAQALGALQRWTAKLEAGEGIAIHCWASVGRSPTLTASLLIAAGVPPEEAWASIAAARGREVPDTLEQRGWSEQFSRP